ncbi:APC amino acid permease [Dentipellis sp. KUC8613]|nr:APC amino acid permease [Dentipellis sp. KUC8613]
MLDRDEKQLASLGYKQELRREYKPWELFGLGFSMIGVLPAMATVLIYAIPNGGTSAMVWGWAVCLVFLTVIGLALAELSSAAPMSGGLYYWTHKLSSPRYKNVLSWVVGYCNSLGLISNIAAGDWGIAVQIMAAVSISRDMEFVPTTGQTFGVFIAIMVVQGFLNSMAAKYFARLQNLYMLINIALCFIVLIGLPIATSSESRNTAKFAFGDFQNLNGWPDGYAFILSFLSPLWAVGLFDPCIHISEEAVNASVAVPWALLSSVLVSGIFGWAINVVLAFNMGTDLQSIIDSPIGQPMAAILFNSFGKKATLGIWSLVVVALFMACSSTVTVASRQTFAFSRDGGLPLSRFLRRVNPHTHTPIYAVWAVVCAGSLLGLLVFAGPAATTAIFSLGVVAQYIAYAVPISARYLGQNDFKKGPFHLGVLSLPIAATAVVWMCFMIVILVFPATPDPTAATMNYTVVVAGGVVILSLAYYYFPKYGGRYWFKGPIRTVDEDTVTNTSSEPTDSADTRSSEKDAVVEIGVVEKYEGDV